MTLRRTLGIGPSLAIAAAAMLFQTPPHMQVYRADDYDDAPPRKPKPKPSPKLRRAQVETGPIVDTTPESKRARRRRLARAKECI